MNTILYAMLLVVLVAALVGLAIATATRPSVPTPPSRSGLTWSPPQQVVIRHPGTISPRS